MTQSVTSRRSIIALRKAPNAKTIVTTANPGVIYAIAYLDLKWDGPAVIERAPQMQGIVDDMWHRSISDIGLAGPD
jgi:hypothetical protein